MGLTLKSRALINVTSTNPLHGSLGSVLRRPLLESLSLVKEEKRVDVKVGGIMMYPGSVYVDVKGKNRE